MGQVVAAVVADTQILAQRGAKLVKVEYEDLQPVIVTIDVRSHHYHHHGSCISLIVIAGFLNHYFSSIPCKQKVVNKINGLK